MGLTSSVSDILISLAGSCSLGTTELIWCFWCLFPVDQQSGTLALLHATPALEAENIPLSSSQEYMKEDETWCLLPLYPWGNLCLYSW